MFNLKDGKIPELFNFLCTKKKEYVTKNGKKFLLNFDRENIVRVNKKNVFFLNFTI